MDIERDSEGRIIREKFDVKTWHEEMLNRKHQPRKKKDEKS